MMRKKSIFAYKIHDDIKDTLWKMTRNTQNEKIRERIWIPYNKEYSITEQANHFSFWQVNENLREYEGRYEKSISYF